VSYDSCIEYTNVSNIKISDLRSTHAVFSNSENHEYLKIQFDGCVVKGSIACDWLVAKKGVGTVAVELKGSDVDHAAEQVMAGLQYVVNCAELPQRLAGLIVCTRYPRIDTKIQRIKVAALKRFRAPIHIQTKAVGVNLEVLLKY
jgi:hypothetical protein